MAAVKDGGVLLAEDENTAVGRPKAVVGGDVADLGISQGLGASAADERPAIHLVLKTAERALLFALSLVCHAMCDH